MAIGFFKKLADIGKQIGGGLVGIARSTLGRIWNVAKPIVSAPSMALEATGLPGGAVAGKLWRAATPIADRILGSR